MGSWAYTVLGVNKAILLGVGVITTWTPKVGKIIAFWAVIMGLGPFFYILLGFRNSKVKNQTQNDTTTWSL